MTRFLRVFAVFALLQPVSNAFANETEWQSADYIQARLLSAKDGAEEKNGFLGGLEVRLSEGWHAYWRMPGDAGLPPIMNWDASENVKTIDVKWPTPERIMVMDFNSFGYEDNVLLPLEITPENPDEPVNVQLKADIMVCEEICVPQNVELSLTVPPEANTKNEAILQRALEKLPAKDKTAGLEIRNLVMGPDALVVTAFSKDGFSHADLFVEVSEDFYVTAKPEIEIDDSDPQIAIMRVAAPDGVKDLADRLMDEDVTLTLTNGRDAIEKSFSF